MSYRISGIYKIESKIKPERVYIGSAVKIADRWSHHLGELKRNAHGNIKLQRHYNKYGESDLQFSILLGCLKEDLIKTEQYFIDSYNPYFNICKIANSQLGIKRSKEYIEKLKGNKRGLGNKGNTTKRIISEETRLRMIESKKNHRSWSKGIKLSEKSKENMRNGWIKRKLNKKII